MNVRQLVSELIYVLGAALGVLAFVHPFLAHAQSGGPVGLAGQNAPLLTTLLVGLSLVALLIELQGQVISAKTVAMLGVLVAIASVLRFIEVVVPMPGGFSPIFVPVILAGYVFGGRFGFLMGAFTLLVSGLITGGVGPWLPYQMFAAGWAGLTAGWLPYIAGQISRLVARDLGVRHRAARLRRSSTVALLLLSAFGFVWGLLYGAIMNIYFWPFAVGSAGQLWEPGLSLGRSIARYAAFYVVTSLGWDLLRAVGNVVLILILGAPVVRALTRFRRRFQFEVHSHA
ncbi:MAG: ECF transporter S component [Anaerolineae bacterium]|jgi:energy-coupling factor transport system substrate-specific component